MPSSSYADQFVSPITSCSELLNAGSLIRVAELINCANEPTVYTLEVVTGSNIGDTSISVFISPVPTGILLPSVFLSAGSKLYFDTATSPVVIADDIKITATTALAAQTVSVDPLLTAVGAESTASTWGMFSVASPTDIPLNLNTNTVDRQDLSYGLQSSMVTTSNDLQSQLAFIATPDDPAVWQVIQPYTLAGKDFFCLIERTGGLRAWGRCKGSGFSIPGAIKEIARGSVQLMFNAPWAYPTLRPYQTPAQQATFDIVGRLAGV